jgi:hypothetical protein
VFADSVVDLNLLNQTRRGCQHNIPANISISCNIHTAIHIRIAACAHITRNIIFPPTFTFPATRPTATTNAPTMNWRTVTDGILTYWLSPKTT